MLVSLDKENSDKTMECKQAPCSGCTTLATSYARHRRLDKSRSAADRSTRRDSQQAAIFSHAQCPAHFHEGLGGDELAGRAVQNIKEAVFRRLGDDFAHAPVDVEIEQHQLLHIVEIPVVIGHGLIVPFE